MARARWIVGFVGLVIVSAPRLTTEPASPQAPRATGRALTIEDYYRVQSVGGPQFSPDSRWILFSATTRVEENQGSRSESYVVPVDGSAQPRRVQHDGKDVTGASWTANGRLRYTVDQQPWTIDPANPAEAPARADGSAGPGGRGGGGRGGGGRGGGGAGAAGAPAGTASPDGRWSIVLRDRAVDGRGAAHTHRLREAPRRALQGRDFRLDGISARRPAVPGSQSVRAARSEPGPRRFQWRHRAAAHAARSRRAAHRCRAGIPPARSSPFSPTPPGATS